MNDDNVTNQKDAATADNRAEWAPYYFFEPVGDWQESMRRAAKEYTQRMKYPGRANARDSAFLSNGTTVGHMRELLEANIVSL